MHLGPRSQAFTSSRLRHCSLLWPVAGIAIYIVYSLCRAISPVDQIEGGLHRCQVPFVSICLAGIVHLNEKLYLHTSYLSPW